VGERGPGSGPAAVPDRPLIVGDWWDAPVEQASPSLLTIEGSDTGDTGLFYPGRVNSLWAEPNRGKSLLCQHLVVEEAVQGRATLTIDFEKPFAHFRSRIRILGATREHALRIGYWNPTRAIRDEDLTDLLAFCAQQQVRTVIIDAVGRATAQAGLDDSSNPEYRQWIDRTVMPIVTAGMAVVLVDHPKKESSGPGRSDVAFYPKGAGAKLDVITGAAYTLRTREPFTRHRPGQAQIICTKDTEGARAIGDHVADLIVSPVSSDFTEVRIRVPSERRPGEPSQRRPTIYMEKVSKMLGQSSEPLSISQLKRMIGGKTEWVGVAVERLLEEGFAVEQAGPRNARLITEKKPFRQTTEPHPERTSEADRPLQSERMGDPGS